MHKQVKTENEHLHESGGLRIPYEVADGITLVVLQDHLEILQEELRKHTEEGQWMHPEDYHRTVTKLIPSLVTLIDYFGGEV